MNPKLSRSTETRVLILGAMEEEIRECLACVELESTEVWNGFALHWGQLDQTPVVVCKSGIGKVFASLITQHLLDRCNVRAVLFTGVAGAVAADLDPGDLLIAERLVHHDLDVRALGFERGHIPFTDFRYFESDPQCVQAALGVELSGVRMRTGCIGTGDQFITDRSHLPDLGLDAVDMEGAAVAQVCTVNSIPFLIVRIISDRADGSAQLDFATNLPRLAHHSVEVLKAVVRSLS